MPYLSPVPLAREHLLDGFQCQSEEQTRWLCLHSRQSMAMGLTRVFVVTLSDSAEVVAYYAWTMAQVTHANAPPRLRKGAAKYPQPVALLARLGVAAEHEGRGLGAALLQDVIRRTPELRGEIGCRGLLIHAETQKAKGFYQHLIPGLDESPTNELHLVALMKDIVQTLSTR